MRSVYLDHAATTAVRPEVLEAMWPFFSQVAGNPSSVHSAGALAREALDRAHETVAEILGCRPGEIIFTSGGTEADNLALMGVVHAARDRGRHIITSQIEHDAVLHTCQMLEREGFRVTYLPVDREGVVDVKALEAALDEETILVSIMLANNEVGTVQPMEEIGRMVRSRGILLHTDAVQAAGAMDINVDHCGVDLLTISAHKIYGPKGVGALYVRRGTPLASMMHGGDQERGRRSGTENVPGVIGLAVALALAEGERSVAVPRLVALRDQLIEETLASVTDAYLTGHATRRLPGHASFYLEGVTGESVLVNLDVAGISCSSGSACKAGSTDPSHVLTAIGLPRSLAKNGLRMTLGRENDDADVDYVLETLPRVVEQLRSGATAPV